MSRVVAQLLGRGGGAARPRIWLHAADAPGRVKLCAGLTVAERLRTLPGVTDPTDLRVSDEERDATAREIREHYASGRLDDDELSERLSAAYGAKTQSQLQAVRADLPPLPPSPAARKAELVARRGELSRQLLQQTGASLSPFIICTLIWAVSGATGFFWPVFLLIVVLLPLVGNGWALYGPSPELERVERHLQQRRQGGDPSGRGERRQERRDARRDRHSHHRRRL
jgi:hypothetical protein